MRVKLIGVSNAARKLNPLAQDKENRRRLIAVRWAREGEAVNGHAVVT